MATIPKIIKALLNFGRMLPEELLAHGYGVVKGLTGNTNFTNLPFDLTLLKTALDNYAALIADAKDGGKKAILARNRQGEDIIRMLRALATNVELNCKDNMEIFLTSGFQPRSSTRTPAQPVGTPIITKFDYGEPGQMLVSIKSVRGAKTYEVYFGPAGPGGVMPTTFSMKTVPNVRTAVIIDGLTPGATYAFKVRAYGPLGFSEYSDPVTRMVV